MINYDVDEDGLSSSSSYADFPPLRYKPRNAASSGQISRQPTQFFQDICTRLEQLKLQLLVVEEQHPNFPDDNNNGGVIRNIKSNARKGQNTPSGKTQIRRSRSTEVRTRKCGNKCQCPVHHDQDRIPQLQGPRTAGDRTFRISSAGHPVDYANQYARTPWKYSQEKQQIDGQQSTYSTRRIRRKPPCKKYRILCESPFGRSAKVALRSLQHYHIDLDNLPFMPSDRTGHAQSHSLPANIQQLIGKLKGHNFELCDSVECRSMPLLDSGQLEREYARMYKDYEQVKLELMRTDSIAAVLDLMKEKSDLRTQLKHIAWSLELSKRSNPSAHPKIQPILGNTKSTETMYNFTESKSGDLASLVQDNQRELLRTLRDTQTLFG